MYRRKHRSNNNSWERRKLKEADGYLYGYPAGGRYLGTWVPGRQRSDSVIWANMASPFRMTRYLLGS